MVKPNRRSSGIGTGWWQSRAEGWPLQCPEEVEFFFDGGEVFVAGGEGSAVKARPGESGGRPPHSKQDGERGRAGSVGVGAEAEEPVAAGGDEGGRGFALKLVGLVEQSSEFGAGADGIEPSEDNQLPSPSDR